MLVIICTEVAHGRTPESCISNQPNLAYSHMCLIPMKLNMGLKSDLRGDGRQNKTEVIASDVKDEEVTLI